MSFTPLDIKQLAYMALCRKIYESLGGDGTASAMAPNADVVEAFGQRALLPQEIAEETEFAAGLSYFEPYKMEPRYLMNGIEPAAPIPEELVFAGLSVVDIENLAPDPEPEEVAGLLDIVVTLDITQPGVYQLTLTPHTGEASMRLLLEGGDDG